MRQTLDQELSIAELRQNKNVAKDEEEMRSKPFKGDPQPNQGESISKTIINLPVEANLQAPD